MAQSKNKIAANRLPEHMLATGAVGFFIALLVVKYHSGDHLTG
jgi:hypothetical protein